MAKRHRKPTRRFREEEMSVEDFELILEKLESEGLRFQGLEVGKTFAGEPFEEWLGISADTLALGYVRACARSNGLSVTFYSHREEWDVESVRVETGQEAWLPPNYERAAHILLTRSEGNLTRIGVPWNQISILKNHGLFGIAA